MPTYQYACTDPECANRFEVVQSFTDPAASECPVCHGPVRKVFSSVGVVFKGSGFYRNDSRSESNGGGSAKSESRSESGAKSDSKSESKSDTASTSSAKSDSGSTSAAKSDSSSSSAKSAGSPGPSSGGTSSKAAASA